MGMIKEVARNASIGYFVRILSSTRYRSTARGIAQFTEIHKCKGADFQCTSARALAAADGSAKRTFARRERGADAGRSAGSPRVHAP